MKKYVALMTIQEREEAPEEGDGSTFTVLDASEVSTALANMSEERIAEFAEKGESFKIEL